MEVKDFFHILHRRKGVIVSFWLIFIILGAVATFAQPLKYEAKSRLLIVQNISGVDPYTVSKSNQYLSSLFSQVIYSNSFFDLVTGTNNFDIDKTYFTDNYKKQMKIWSKTVSATSNDAGIIQISIYHPNPYQAKQIALAVNDVLINQGFNYQGGGEGVKVKIIDQPLISDYPVKPNLIFNFFAFSILGILAGLIYLYFNPHKSMVLKLSTKPLNIPPAPARQPIQVKSQPVRSEPIRIQPIQTPRPAQPIEPAQSFEPRHPAEKVMVDYEDEITDSTPKEKEPEEGYEARGDIRNVIKRF